MQLLQTKSLGMTYAGKVALQDVNFTIEAGRIIGLLGPNGSGKTTLLKIIADLIQPTSGEVLYPNNAKRGTASRKTVSFMPDEMMFPAYMTVRDTFQFYRDMYPDYDDNLAEQMQKLLGFEEKEMKSKFKSLSKGWKERVALALTFSRKTSVYLLDEPLGGIDPVGKKRIIDAILSMQLEDSSIVISTHLVKDVERIFDTVWFISESKIVFCGECDEMREQSGKTVEQAYLEVFDNDC